MWLVPRLAILDSLQCKYPIQLRGLVGWCLTSQRIIGHFGDDFYRQYDQTISVKALKETLMWLSLSLCLATFDYLHHFTVDWRVAEIGNSNLDLNWWSVETGMNTLPNVYNLTMSPLKITQKLLTAYAVHSVELRVAEIGFELAICGTVV